MTETVKLGEFTVKVLDPKILVFTNSLKNPEGLIEYYEKLNNWGGWHAFGVQSQQEAPEDSPKMSTKNFPTVEDWSQLFGRVPQNPYRDEIHLTFLNASKLYADYTNTILPSWEYFSSWSVAKYTEDTDPLNDPELTMGHHTDYIQKEHGAPGNKFELTAVFYPNDDYEGGEISFRIIKPGTYTVEKEITYKPTKGDLIIFPSKDPYYHGVKRIWKNPKYIIRLYWHWEDEIGSVEWNKLKEKYGAHEFEKMEKERMKRNDLFSHDPVQKPLLTFSQYYDLLDRGLLPERENWEKISILLKNILESNGKIYDKF